MKVIGVVCSPRLKGNTEILVEEALEAASGQGAEVELYPAGRLQIAPCDGCEECRGSGECHIADDMQALFAKLKESDGIIFGSPVYSWGVSAQAKAVIDRMHLFRPRRSMSGKVGGAIVVAKTRGMTDALSAIVGWFTSHRMVVAASASAMAGFEKGEVRRDAHGMAEARRVGRAVALVAQATRTIAPDL